MYTYSQISDDVYYIGSSDRKISLFENLYPVPNGVSYNSYFVDDEKTVVVDAVDRSVSETFFENLDVLLGGRKLDYLIINHMEFDHAATVGRVVEKYPEVKLVCNSKTVPMLKNYFDFDVDSRAVVVGEGQTLCTGKHEFVFMMAPMVHWPEVMVSYVKDLKMLFSADAFGTFGAVYGSVFADPDTFDFDEARRYYANIVGKYGVQVKALLKKAAATEIAAVCPLHGPVWNRGFEKYFSLYEKWSAYEPEKSGVVIAYSSVYGNTEKAVKAFAELLARKGVADIRVFDVSADDSSYILSEVFARDTLVLASTTYNNGIFPKMEYLVSELVSHNIANRRIAVIENGSWAPVAAKLIVEKLEKLKNITYLGAPFTLRSSLKPCQMQELDNLAGEVAAGLSK